MNFEEQNFDENLNKAIKEHSRRLIEYDIERVADFSKRVSDKILNQIDRIEDDDLAIELTTFLGAVIGGYSQAVLELKAEVFKLRGEIIDIRAGEQDFNLN